jgi:hypothetical protein
VVRTHQVIAIASLERAVAAGEAASARTYSYEADDGDMGTNILRESIIPAADLMGGAGTTNWAVVAPERKQIPIVELTGQATLVG